jgi:CBS-domain-containing membrane protein
VNSSTNLLEIAKTFAKGVHRVAVIDSTIKRVEDVFSQIDMVQFLAERGVWIGSKLEKPIYQTSLYSKSVETVGRSTTAVQAFRKMKQSGYSGLGVVDDNGRMVASISATDLLV